jgi:hypothetical protein
MIKEKSGKYLLSVEGEFNEILRNVYGRKIWKLKEIDSARLMKLKVWESIYAVDMKYILGKLLPYYWNILPKYLKAKVERNQTLGVKIASLVSIRSEDILDQAIIEDFPDGENFQSRKEDARNECIEMIALDNDEIPARPKKMLAYNKVSDAMKAYHRKIERQRSAFSRLAKKRRRMAWRGNPWR